MVAMADPEGVGATGTLPLGRPIIFFFKKIIIKKQKRKTKSDLNHTLCGTFPVYGVW